MTEGIPKVESFNWEESPLAEAYRLLGAIEPQDLYKKYVALEQIAFTSPDKMVLWDYDNPDLVHNKVKEILENADTSSMDEYELERRKRILWFWYHHAISAASWHQDKEKMKFFSEKAMEFEDDSNILTRTMYLLVHDKVEEAEEWVNNPSVDPSIDITGNIETYQEMIENYKKTGWLF
jgi:hypothetical protein